MLQAEYDPSNVGINDSLPASMKSTPDSTNQKLLNILADIENEYGDNLLNVSDLVKLNSMRGDTLERCASDYGIARIDDDDDFLRFQIRLQKLKSQIGTVTDDTRLFIATALNIAPNEFEIVQTGIEEIEVQNIPFDFKTNDKSGVKRQIISDAIQSIIPPEITLDDIQYAKKVQGDLYIGFAMEKSIERNGGMVI